MARWRPFPGLVAGAVSILIISGVSYGQKPVIPVPEEKALELEAPPKTEPTEVPKPSPQPARPPEKPLIIPEKKAPEPRPAFSGILPGYLSPQRDVGPGKIVGKEGIGEMLSLGEVARINLGSEAGVQPGDLFYPYLVLPRVRHPVTKELVGYPVKVVGELKVIETGPKFSRAVVTEISDAIFVGYSVRPRIPRLEKLFPKKGDPALSGIVLATLDKVSRFADNNIVIIDLGEKDGVQPGQVFIVYREPLILARLIILATQEKSSTALVLKSLDAFQIGDRVRGGEP